MRSRGVIFAALLIAIGGCVTHSRTMIASPATHSPTTQPILYHRTGGIAGTDDRIVIWPDRVVQVNGKILPSATARLTKDRFKNLLTMFRGWRSLNDEYEADAADAYVITISYAGKSVRAMDLAPDLPEQFRGIFTEIEAIAAEAANSDSTPAPQSP
jgi:hypothetical protein